MGSQIWTLVAVVVGAAMSYLVTVLNERARHRREALTRWDVRRLEVYADYVSAVEQLAGLTRRIMAAKGIERHPRPGIDLSRASELLDEAEAKRGLAFSSVTLLGDPATIEAGHELNRGVWRLLWFARELVPSDQGSWDAANGRYRAARNHFHDKARHALGVLGPAPPRPDQPLFEDLHGTGSAESQ